MSIQYIAPKPYYPHEGMITCLQGRMADGRETKTVKCTTFGFWSHTPTFCSGKIFYNFVLYIYSVAIMALLCINNNSQ